MDNYTPSIEAVRQANSIYNNVILTLVLNPKKIIEAYRLLTGCTDVLVNQKYAHRYVHSYFYYKKYLQIYPNYEKENENSNSSIDTNSDTNSTVNSDTNTTNTDKLITDSIDVLDFAFELPEEEVNEIENDEELNLINRIAELEKELELALTSDDWKLIKNTRMKITKAKNKLTAINNNN